MSVIYTSPPGEVWDPDTGEWVFTPGTTIPLEPEEWEEDD